MRITELSDGSTTVAAAASAAVVCLFGDTSGAWGVATDEPDGRMVELVDADSAIEEGIRPIAADYFSGKIPDIPALVHRFRALLEPFAG